MWAALLAKHGVIYFSLGFFALLLENLIEQPKPSYGANVTWFTLSLQGSAVLGAMIASVAVIAIFLNLLRLRIAKVPYDELDLAYYPRFRGLAKVQTTRPQVCARLGIALLLLSYWAWCIYENILHRFYSYMHGWFWPPNAILMTILALWGAAWLTETTNRPTRQVLPICYVYWACLLLNWQVLGCSYVIE